MLTELVESGHKIEERLKAMESEINRTNSEGKETGTQINGVDQKGKVNSQPEQNEETRIKKTEETLRNLQDKFKHPNIRIIGMPEGEEED